MTVLYGREPSISLCVEQTYMYLRATYSQETKRKHLGILGKLRSQALGEVVLNVVVVPVVLLASAHACMGRKRRKQERRWRMSGYRRRKKTQKSENQKVRGVGWGRHLSAHYTTTPTTTQWLNTSIPLWSLISSAVLASARWGIRPSPIQARPTASRPTVRLHPSGYHLDPIHPSNYIIASDSIA